jgi:CRISPR-associated protein Csb3
MSELYFCIDFVNPGQVIAALGLFELASRLQPTVQGHFNFHSRTFILSNADSLEPSALLTQLCQSRLDEDQSQKSVLLLSEPFNLRLDWWQGRDEDESVPKTWAGRQDVCRVARAAQRALHRVVTKPGFRPEQLFTYSHPLIDSSSDKEKLVAPFYFDAFVSRIHSRDVGFSLDQHDIKVVPSPATELLCLVGLQRFRPRLDNGRYSYCLWDQPLGPVVASAVFNACLRLPDGGHCFNFALRYRDDQRRYKAFGYAKSSY